MKIALDYDNTYTADPKLWNEFVKGAVKSKHAIRIVTYRSVTSDNENLIEAAKKLGVRIMFTAGVAKRKHCTDKGWEPDIWIDDKPESIIEDSTKEFCVI
jgi:hypothetical protein